jgi:hypothetical protein
MLTPPTPSHLFWEFALSSLAATSAGKKVSCLAQVSQGEKEVT